MAEQRSPWARYQRDLERDDFLHDPAQEQAVKVIQALYEQLVVADGSRGLSALMDRLRGRTRSAPRGLYLWGGVGRGKTYLMDCFHDALPRQDKRRVHFHHFMEEVHDGLKRHADAEDPLVLVARDLLDEVRILCFDEFFVSDIADAMILARLLETLFAGGLTLVATSNIPPRELYRDGLQRARFLPAIDLLQTHCRVLEVDGGIDYRLRILEQAEIYHSPLGPEADAILEHSFQQLAPGEIERDVTIHVNHRRLDARAITDGLAWFDFDALCRTARAAPDYIELARRFNTVLISNVPQLDDEANDPTRRFITLVDELYDRNVNLILSAAVPVDELYTGERLAFEFRRTVSRLTEMQSHEYLGREHLA